MQPPKLLKIKCEQLTDQLIEGGCSLVISLSLSFSGNGTCKNVSGQEVGALSELELWLRTMETLLIYNIISCCS